MSRTERKSKRRKRDTQEAALMDEAPAVEPMAEEARPVEITTREISPPAPALADEAWPRRDWPAHAGPRPEGFGVVVLRSALNAIHRHGQVTPEIEICGVLVGNVFRDDAGPFLLIEAIVRGDFAGSANSQVTFTAETWDHIQKEMDAEHPDQKIVGWYHTHPSFGIFLSEMDVFIHGNFFNMPWQVALVYDPSNGDEGVFVWRDGKTERTNYSIEEDAEKELPTVPVSPELGAAALADFSRRMQGVERRQKRLFILVSFLLVIAVVWPFILNAIMADRHQQAVLRHPSTEPAIPVAASRPVVAAVAPPRASATTTSVAEELPTAPTTAPAVTQPATVPSIQWERVVKAVPPTQPAVATTAPADGRESPPTVIRPVTPKTGGAKVLEGPTDGRP